MENIQHVHNVAAGRTRAANQATRLISRPKYFLPEICGAGPAIDEIANDVPHGLSADLRRTQASWLKPQSPPPPPRPVVAEDAPNRRCSSDANPFARSGSPSGELDGQREIDDADDADRIAVWIPCWTAKPRHR